MAVQIITDSTSYIDETLRTTLGINVVSLNVLFDDDNFKEVDLKNDTFYEMMEKRGIPTSSQPSVEEIYSCMENIIKKGDSILCVFLSSDMSGTYSTAHMVKEMILEKYVNAKIEIVDSRSNSMQLGFAAIVAARAAKDGQSLEEVKTIAIENTRRSRFLFIPDNFVYLKKGGRIGGASALIGNILKIIPILTVEDGKTSIANKIRTKRRAKLEMVDMFLNDVNKFGLGEVAIHHINCIDEAKDLALILKQNLNIQVPICDIGPVIGLHVGPGAIGIAYYTKNPIR
ncbi:DegV family protein [Clostridium sp. 'White wine YQ']|uniref:DegV family protein n=1 Tax=Clostridium sp. 'White wine YQ' TaxID=3027474 RepID=UPI0023665890|nr:DegV family protein [Clostridium sp. 'White wine YQ']MDD7796366.1 DegV family protein [Clostridium sp. 'White wine YQ']